VKSAFEVAKVNSEQEQLAQEQESHQKQLQDISSELAPLKATMGDMVKRSISLPESSLLLMILCIK